VVVSGGLQASHMLVGSAGCQPAGLGSLPRPGNGASPRGCARANVAGRAAGNYRLAACAPQNSRNRLGCL